MGWTDSMLSELKEIGGVELHRTDVISTVFVSDEHAWLATFLLGDCQQNIRGHLVFDGGRDRAHDALLLQGREVEHAVSPLFRWGVRSYSGLRSRNAATSAVGSAEVLSPAERLPSSIAGASVSCTPA